MKLFVTGVQMCIKDLDNTKKSLVDHKNMYLRSLWTEVDKNMDGHLDKKEIRKLLQNINYQIDDSYFNRFFCKHDSNNN